MRNLNEENNGIQARCFCLMAIILASVIGWVMMGTAAAQGKSVSEEILDILKDKGQITDQQYDELLEKAQEEKKEIKGKDTDFKAYWKDGANLSTRDERFKIKFGGRIQADWAAYDPDSKLKRAFEDDIEGFGTEFRRARVYISGTLYDTVEFKAEYDFASGDADFNDVWIGLKDIPFVNQVKVGHMKEPFSLEAQTSANYILFMERSPLYAFYAGRNMGVRIDNSALNNRLTWHAGIFEEADNFGDSFNDFSDYNATARVTGLPWNADDGSKLLHLGLSYSHQFRSEDNTTVRYRTKPESNITDAYLVNTDYIPVDDADLINPELSLVYGPFSLQAEYTRSFLESDTGDDPEFEGYYIQGGYFLTGEHRNYSASNGYFTRVRPEQNFHPVKGGWGAWEVALRYSFIDLNDGDIRGGKEKDVAAGLNWYLNPNVRFMFNYVHAAIEDREFTDDGEANIYQGRFQIDF